MSAYLTIQEAAKYLNRNEEDIQKLIENGELYYKIENQIPLIHEKQLENLKKKFEEEDRIGSH